MLGLTPSGVPGDADGGILFVPVQHDGNSQASREEVAKVVALTQELLLSQLADGERLRPLQLDDILFVAPYNMQVKWLQEALPDGAKVASVDKFQGQEAAVVVISLCTSPGESGPRGIGFVLDLNRINVAISRAQRLAIVVADPRLATTSCSTIDQMERFNLFSRLKENTRSVPGS